MLQTRLDLYYKQKKLPLYTLQELCMSAVPGNLKLPHGLAKLTKPCAKCDKGFLYDHNGGDLCIKCRVCKCCGMHGKCIRKKSVLDDTQKLCYYEDPLYACTECPAHTQAYCPACRCYVMFVYTVRLYDKSTGRTWLSENCFDCIVDQECFDCHKKYSDSYDVYGDYIYNLYFCTIKDEERVPEQRKVCNRCFQRQAYDI
nr:maco-A 18 [Mamestra configurata nucleopolyhedrovirus A]